MNKETKYTVAEIQHRDPPRSGQTVSGYGAAVPTAWCVRLAGDPRWRRVYCTIFSNIGTTWIRIRGAKHVIDGRYDARPELWVVDPDPWGEGACGVYADTVEDTAPVLLTRRAYAEQEAQWCVWHEDSGGPIPGPNPPYRVEFCLSSGWRRFAAHLDGDYIDERAAGEPVPCECCARAGSPSTDCQCPCHAL